MLTASAIDAKPSLAQCQTPGRLLGLGDGSELRRVVPSLASTCHVATPGLQSTVFGFDFGIEY